MAATGIEASEDTSAIAPPARRHMAATPGGKPVA
jgi:hypothetical protein